MDCKVFQMMPDIIILKVRKFRQPTSNCSGTVRQKAMVVGGGGGAQLPSLNRVKREWTY